MIDLNGIVTQVRFGELVGISQPAVSDLLSRGIIQDGGSAGQWLISYCAHLREQAAGRAASGDLDLATERARLAKEQADKVAMQNAVTRGELAPAYLIEEVLTKVAGRIAGILDAIPGMIRRRVPTLTSDDVDLIAGQIAQARNVVAGMSLRILDDKPDSDDDDAPIIEAEAA